MRKILKRKRRRKRRARRIAAACLSAALLLTGFAAVPAQAARFSDIQGHWAQKKIERAVELGLFSGVSETRFAPDRKLTRAMFVCVLAKCSGYHPDEYRMSRFSDVEETAWYAPAVAWAAEQGVSAGTSADTFSPDLEITREQVAVMLLHYAGLQNRILPRVRAGQLFSDTDLCADYALDAVYTLYRSGIVSGVPDGGFHPKGLMTRAECAAVLCNYVDTVGRAYAADERAALISHRGYSAAAPENTMPAFALAAQKGFAFVETDVQFTADGVPVLLHDRTIDRTSDGSGRVDALTYRELLQYDFGAWKSPQYAGTRIAALEDLFALCAEKGLHAMVELKYPMTEEQVRQLADLADAYGMRGRVTWISFFVQNLRTMEQVNPEAELFLAVDRLNRSSLRAAGELKNGSNTVGVTAPYTELTPAKRAACLRGGLALGVWTVSDRQECIRQINTCAQFLTTDGITAQEVYAGQ